MTSLIEKIDIAKQRIRGVTEEAAKRKWCPFVRELGDDAVSYNRDYSGQMIGRCLGSNCMSWRWSEVFFGLSDEQRDRVLSVSQGIAPQGADPREDLNDAERSLVEAEPHGYCGLAGPVQ